MIAIRPENPLIVQSDRTLLLEVAHPDFEQVRDELSRFAELVKSPEHIHTFRVTPLSLWNASASGVSCDEMIATLDRWSKYPVPQNLTQEIQDHGTRYGKLRLVQKGDRLALEMDDRGLFWEIEHQKALQGFLAEPYPDEKGIYLNTGSRGEVKLHLIRLGHPVQDLAGYKPGDPLAFEMSPELKASGKAFGLRPYQKAAVDVFHAGGGPEGGAGVLVLPCGAGKTVIGIGCMDRLQTCTLVLTTNGTAVQQWKQELLDKTSLTEDQVGLYTGDTKEIKPGHHRHLPDPHLPQEQGSALRAFQALRGRQLGARSSTTRSTCSPRRSSAPWPSSRPSGAWASPPRSCARTARRRMSSPSSAPSAWTCPGRCWRRRASSPRPTALRSACPCPRTSAWNTPSPTSACASASPPRTASSWRWWTSCWRAIRANPSSSSASTWSSCASWASGWAARCITGQTPEKEREELFRKFRTGELRVLIVSKVANFAIDLPDASVAIQVSGTFGSRQEEAQRLGRILRPKGDRNVSYFYSLISKDTSEQEFARNRQLFLTEQGYRYLIESRHFESNGVLSEPKVWKQLLEETAG